MSESPYIEYVHAGGNRQPAAAGWDHESGILAFGSDQNVAIWRPLDAKHAGISTLLKGHTDLVNAVHFLPQRSNGMIYLLTGAADSTLRLWQLDPSSGKTACLAVLKEHTASINAIATTPGSDIFVTAAADSSICIWRYDESSPERCSWLRRLTLSPPYIPMSLCLHQFPNGHVKDSLFLAVSGTKSTIQMYTLDFGKGSVDCSLHATLAGHEGWVRSLTATQDGNSDILMASASQDKYVRLWRIQPADKQAQTSGTTNGDLMASAHPLKKKVQVLRTQGFEFTVSFEALLLGHEDWVYSAAWSPEGNTRRLLTASADNSLSIWEADESSGIWTSTSRLGEISEQKGSTSATGSSGGLWTGLWSPNGDAIACLGRTGSWRVWEFDQDKEYWVGQVGVSGHVRPVQDLVWEPQGQYLLSTSLDQTSRLHAQWHQESTINWHEFSRPQIHGYDLNCLASLGQTRFVSGADEKLLRVFDEPKTIGTLLEKLCKITPSSIEGLPEAAEVGVLGLSNKAIDEEGEAPLDEETENTTPAAPRLQLDMTQPPLEDHLARHTLWPETEKLYGHGYEISAVASSNSHSIIATACKASSVDHAVIRLYDTKDWHEIRPSLAAHTLTIARLRFSPDDQYLLSVGRDRQWAIFKRSDPSSPSSSYNLAASNPKGHSRMILDAAWAPTTTRRLFATAGRDKLVKIWELTITDSSETALLVATITRPSTVTAIDFAPTLDTQDDQVLTLATGEDNGRITIHTISIAAWEIQTSTVETSLCPSKAVTRLAWRPRDGQGDENRCLGVASADCSLRLLSFPS